LATFLNAGLQRIWQRLHAMASGENVVFSPLQKNQILPAQKITVCLHDLPDIISHWSLGCSLNNRSVLVYLLLHELQTHSSWNGNYFFWQALLDK